MEHPFLMFLDHTQRRTTVGRLLWTSDQLVTETSTWQHTTLTTDKYPCPRWDSNPRSQQASGQTSRLLSRKPSFNPNEFQVGFVVHPGRWVRLSFYNLRFTMAFIIAQVLYSKPSVIQGRDNGSISGGFSKDYSFIHTPPLPQNNKKKVHTVHTKPNKTLARV